MKRIFACFLMLILLAVCFTCMSRSASAAQQPYGYSLLENDVQRAAYEEILEGIKTLNPEIKLSISATAASLEAVKGDVMKAIQMVYKDSPELFWFHMDSDISITGTDDNMQISIIPSYVLDGQAVSAESDQLTTANNLLQQAVAAALATVPAEASDYEVALALHDYIVNHVEYVHEGDHQTAYGALVGGKAVCAGYARAYQLLLTQAGIPCSYIQGESYDSSGSLVNHAWNLVWLDGNCCYTDVTWDDQGDSYVFHEYFNLSKEEISKTHILDSNEVLPESCGHEDYRFFINNADNAICDIRDQIEDEDVAQCFQLKSCEGKEAVYYCTVHYHGDDYASWFDSHMENICSIIGLESFVCKSVDVGHEHYLLLSGTMADTESTPVPEPTQTQGAANATEQTEEISATQATELTAPVEPETSPQASLSTKPMSTERSPSATVHKDMEKKPFESDSIQVVIIAIVAGISVAGIGCGIALYFSSRKNKS